MQINGTNGSSKLDGLSIRVSPITLPTGQGASLTVRHALQEHGAVVPPSQADDLHASIMSVPNILLPSLALQIALGVGELDRRKKARTILSGTFWGMNTERPADPRIVVYANRNSFTVFFTQRDRWSVSQEITLTWQGRNSLVLTGVECATTMNIPDPEREVCAAWFESQRVRLENHFAKRLAQAPSNAGAEA